MIEVADIIRSVNNIKTGEDDHDQWYDEGDDADDNVDDLDNSWCRQFVSCCQANDPLDQVQCSHPVAFSQRYLITEVILDCINETDSNRIFTHEWHKGQNFEQVNK